MWVLQEIHVKILVDAGSTPLLKTVRPVEADSEWVADRAVEAEDERIEGLRAHELAGLPAEYRLNDLPPGHQPREVVPLDEHRVEGEVAVEVEDSSSVSLLLNELEHDVREQVGGRVDPQVFLHAPLLGEEVVSLRLDLSRLAEVPQADPVEPGRHGVDGEILRAANIHHGVEVQLELLQAVPRPTAPTISHHHLLLIPTLPGRVKSDPVLLTSEVYPNRHVVE